jgi:5,5'-dehydrodivanillate O-demethylase oxygenase subunit
MVTAEENEFLTRIGPGTPMGELMRRYWHPVAVARELSDENPTKFVRVLGEDLVLFKDKCGNVGLIQDHCAHRGASLLYGRVEERGISCAYHGWLYDTNGDCLECPAEPAGSKFHLTVKVRAYPVQRFLGFYWAYLGPLPAPIIPPYDIWQRRDGYHGVIIYPLVDCNWLQSMENAVDPSHLHILHQGGAAMAGVMPGTTRGRIDTIDMDSFDFREIPFGILKSRPYKNGPLDRHPLMFPNNCRVGNSTQFRVPIDDTHTWHVYIIFEPTPDGSIVDQSEDEIPVEYMEPFKFPPDALHPNARYLNHQTLAQDHMTWETQGLIYDRTGERLATADRGIQLYRELLMREARKLQDGLEPIGIFRAGTPTIDTYFAESIDRDTGGRWKRKDEDRRDLVGIGAAPIGEPARGSGGKAPTAP